MGQRQGGGCLVYVSDKLKSYECKELNNLPGDDSVWCWVRVTSDTKILVGCIYRSTGSGVTNNELLMNQLVQASEVAGNNRIILMGDFNLKEINWLENEIEEGSQYKRLLSAPTCLKTHKIQRRSRIIA